MTEFEQRCYGMSEADLKARHANYINAVGVEMFVAGILSDCQELGVSEEVRKMLNKAKFFLFENVRIHESELHNLYKSKRVRGEWYMINREDIKSIKRKYRSLSIENNDIISIVRERL